MAAGIAALGLAGTALDDFAGTAVDFVETVSLGIGIETHLVAAEAEDFGAAGNVVDAAGTAAHFAGTGENSTVEIDLAALPGTEEQGTAPAVEAEIEELGLAVADCIELSGPKNNTVACYRVFAPG